MHNLRSVSFHTNAPYKNRLRACAITDTARCLHVQSPDMSAKQYPLFCIEMNAFNGITIGAECSGFLISLGRIKECMCI